jgi:hypothetical protein
MNTRILNRDSRLPADGWYEIETPGEHLNREAGVVQLNDQTAFETIANRFKEEAAQPNFGGMLIDRDHFSLDPEKTSESLGWMMDVRNRDGHLEGKIDWTGVGAPLVEGKTFKFFSTVYDPADVEKVGTRKIKNREYPLVRPLRLDRLALTNDPNNKGGKPISNRQPAATAERSENPIRSTMKSVLKQLGLADDASEESAVAALTLIQNRASQLDAITQERDQLLATQVDADLEKYKAVIKNAEAVKKALIANRKGTLEFLDGLQAAAAPAASAERPARITNREKAATPTATSDKAAKEEARAKRIANRAHEISRERKISYASAFSEAERAEEPV